MSTGAPTPTAAATIIEVLDSGEIETLTELKMIQSALSRAFEVARAKVAAANMLKLKPGMQAVVSNIKPKMLTNQIVEIVRQKDAKYFECRFPSNRALGRYSGQQLGIPASCLTPWQPEGEKS